MKYRAEIDGLRALAVLPVIFFHAGYELFAGGFIGVDIFFVISGYLITTILIEEIESKNFTIVSFYERRARRLLPALFFVMIICIPFAWFWMLPAQMKDFSQSLVAVSFFASNILFWRESGYFAASAEEKPLLHTWSLAVEEQYYVLFPIFLLVAWRFGKNKVFWIIAFIACLSLFFSEYLSRTNSNANFYLALTRAWEILAGSLTAFIIKNRGVRHNNFLSLLGIAAIIFSIFFYDEGTPFPSFYSLVPVIGVLLLILFSTKGTITANILSHKFIVGIGLISYSAYLWHQPLFAFARIRLFDEPTHLLMFILSFASLLLGYLSWRYIERPFRSKANNGFSSFQIFSFALAGICFFVLFGLAGHKSNGFLNHQKWDSSQSILEFKNQTASYIQYCNKNMSNVSFGNNDVCLIGDLSQKPSGMLWGDSYAGSALFGLDKLLKAKEVSYLAIISDGCPPILGISRLENQSDCWLGRQKKILDTFQNDKKLTDLIWIGRFNDITNPIQGNGFLLDKDLPTLEKTQNRLINITSELIKKNKNIVFVLEGVNFEINIPEYLIKLELFNELADESILTKNADEERMSIGLTKEFLGTLKGIAIVDSLDLFCEEAVCNAIMKDGSLLVVDNVHISHQASLLLAKEIMIKLDTLKN